MDTDSADCAPIMGDNWKGSVLRRPGRANLYVQVLDGGVWKRRATPYPDTEDGWAKAQALLAEVRDALQARQRVLGDEPGPLTVRRWSKRWLEDRHALGVDRRGEDGGMVDGHILPAIGDLRLDEVRPRHLIELVRRLRSAGLAPRTVRNIYSLARSMFRDARLAEVTENAPCILTHHQLGRIRDARPGWRDTAVYTRAELESLISDPVVPQDRRVWYGLLGLGMLRTGEAAGLRWAQVRDAEPLGRLVVSTSYDTGRTKTEAERWMPIHPALAVLLAEWRLSGWPATFQRSPQPEDLVVPVPGEKRKGPRLEMGDMRDRHYCRKRLLRDLSALGFRQRRAHDSRRTGISLARADGAERDILRRGTHAAPQDVMELYTSVEWDRLCAEVAKLKIQGRGGTVAAIREVP